MDNPWFIAMQINNQWCFVNSNRILMFLGWTPFNGRNIEIQESACSIIEIIFDLRLGNGATSLEKFTADSLRVMA